jgi:predicted metal-dependent hydrolase
MNKIFFKDLVVEHICKTTLKNSYLSINPHAKIILKTPKVSQAYITSLLTERESWIRKQLHSIALHPAQKINIEDEVLLFGELYSIDRDEALYLRENLEKIQVNNQKNILKCYDDFYKNISQIYLRERLEYFAKVMHLSYKEIKFKKMKSRWGSCSSFGVITLNTQLMKFKKELIDYVLVHELSHLVHMNHSQSFHALVERYIHNSKEIRKELKRIHL